MKVFGLTKQQVFELVKNMDVEYKTLEQVSKNAVRISIRAKTSDSVYARRTFANSFRDSRRSPSLCWHGFKRFVRESFLTGAYRVQTMMGDWRSLDEFNNDLENLACRNVGSLAYPQRLGYDNDCQCGEDLFD